MVPYLDLLHVGQEPQPPPREARVQVVISTSPGDGNQLFELVVDLTNEGGKVVKEEHLVGKHSYIDASYMQDVERACLADEGVKKEIEGLKLPEGSVVCVEPWAYATDGMTDMTRRTTMVKPCLAPIHVLPLLH